MKDIFYAIDFETANNYRNSACSVGVVRFVGGKETDSVYSLIRPPKMYFDPRFIDIHNISYDDVRDKPQFPEVWQTIIEPFISQDEGDVYFVAHRASFDMSVISECCKYYGMSVPEMRSECSLQMARKAWKTFKCHKLTYLAEKFGIEYDAHNALDDARTCGKIYVMAKKKLQKKIRETTVVK